MNDKYVIGVDYGTLSGRAALIRCRDGYQKASSVRKYRHGVIDEFLPNSTKKLPAAFALQHPQDYLDVLENTIPELLKITRVNKEDIIGLGIDFTSCTMLPVDENDVPLCLKPQWENHPHSYVKLWKHHGAQKQADLINHILNENGIANDPRFGGKISSELMIPKILETFQQDRELYEAAFAFTEAGDWLTKTLTGSAKRSCSMAGYKAWWIPEKGYPDNAFFKIIDSDFQNVTHDKLPGEICEIGQKIGNLNEKWANRLGLMPGIAIAASVIDSHAGVPGSGICRKDQMMMVLGTSSVMVALSEKPFADAGICGAFKGGIVPGYYALESGLAAVGDMLEWFTDNCVPVSYTKEAEQKGIRIHELLTQKASRLKPGQSGLLALDWWNGNKTPYVDGNLSGVILGLTLNTKPEEIYRALIESTAFGTRMILELFEKNNIHINEIIASGGIANKNPLFMQIYADVLGKSIKLADSEQTAALGSAIYASLAAGQCNGGYDSYEEAVSSMSRQKDFCYQPCMESKVLYDQLYHLYCSTGRQFHDSELNVLHALRQITVSGQTDVNK